MERSRQSRRPSSEVSDGVGLVGAASLAVLLVLAFSLQLSPVAAAVLFLVGTALPMVVWALVVERVHRRPTTGLDLDSPKPWREVSAIVRVKLIGFGATLGLVAAAYFALRNYGGDDYAIYFGALASVAPFVLVAAPAYVIWTTRRMVEPRDGLWHFGRMVCLDARPADIAPAHDHLLAWAIKAVFLAYMVSILPGNVGATLAFDPAAMAGDPVRAIIFLIQVAFLFDVCFGTIGYILTFRVLDSHIRSANPYISAWVAALVCYPPVALMGSGGPLDFRANTLDWTDWLAGQPVHLLAWGSAILALTVIYAWATVVFGIRFSNLTHRGIITTGPFRFTKHPAYLCKNVAWWLAHLPFLSTAGPGEAARNCLLLLAVNAVYFARAKTEERHLRADPLYRAYADWIAEHGLFARTRRAIRLGRTQRPLVDRA